MKKEKTLIASLITLVLIIVSGLFTIVTIERDKSLTMVSDGIFSVSSTSEDTSGDTSGDVQCDDYYYPTCEDIVGEGGLYKWHGGLVKILHLR